MFELIAHRGASKEAPENTISAMQLALSIGVDYLEFDIHFSKDGVPVVIHDKSLRRTTGGKCVENVHALNFTALSSFDVGSWFDPRFSGERLPSLESILQLQRGATGLMMEIKKGYDPKASVAAVRTCLKKTNPTHVFIGSFCVDILQEVRRQLPDYEAIGIVEKEALIFPMQKLHLKRMAIWYKLLTPSLIQNLHEEGTLVWAFTVDTIREAKFLLSIGINGLITNDPRLLKQLMLHI